MNKRLKIECCFLSVLAMIFLAACTQSAPNSNPLPVSSDGVPDNISLSEPETNLSQADTLELVLWTPSFFNPDPTASNIASDSLTEAYIRFETENPGSRITVQTKSEQGGATLYEYISSAQKVAPSILPDMIMLESQQLWAIADLGLIPPLASGELAARDDVYKFAQDAVTYKDNVYGIPYVANILHTVQMKKSASDLEPAAAAVPATWAELFDAKTGYFFPAGGRNGQGNDTILLQYIGAGGELANEKALAQPDALVDVLNFMDRGMRNQIIPQNVIDYSDVDSAWLSLNSVSDGLIEISSTRYLEQRRNLNVAAFGATPTKLGQRVTIGRVWAFAVLATDPEQRVRAFKLIEHLVDPATLGPWGMDAHRLPVYRGALDRWGDGEPYYDFVRNQLEVAVALPNGTSFVGFSSEMHQALLAVLSGEITAEEAVANIESR